jgi:iron complex outermembrane receptor protein
MRKHALFTTICLSALGCAAAVHAQTAQDVQPAPAVASLPEVVVTANKRPEQLQRTAQSVTVLTAAALETAGAVTVLDLSKIAPDLNFSQRGASTLIEIRGVSSRGYDERSDPAISVALDGVFLQRSTTLDAAMFDVDRVEVLRGPQGVLYGRDATGGAINVFSAKPTNTYESTASLQLGNYDAVRAEVMTNAPITDTLAVRIAAFHDEHEGYTNNGPAGRGDDGNLTGARISFKWKPTSQLTTNLLVEDTRQTGTGPVRLGVPIDFSPQGYIIDQSSSSLIKSRSDWTLDKRGTINASSIAGRWSATYDLNWASLSYTGGYAHSNVFRDEDYDGTDSPTYGFPQGSVLDTQTHEVRLTSEGNSKFSYQLGGLYFQEHEELNAAFSSVFEPGGPYLPEYTYDYYSQPQFGVDTQSEAAFVQVGYQITESIKADAGIRYTQDHKTELGQEGDFGYSATDAVLHSSFTPENLKANSSKATYHLGVEDQFTSTNLVYAKYDTGYKGGGFTEVNAYGPETISSYEVGSKNRFFGNKLQLNLSAFDYDYRNQQVQEFYDGQYVTINAGASKIYGVEAESLAAFTPVDRANLSVSWLHARFTNFIYNTPWEPANYGPPANQNVQLAGKTPVQSPTWTVNFGLEHDFHISTGKITTRFQTQFESMYHLSVLNLAGDEQPSFTKSDIIVTYTPISERYSLQLFVRNLENDRTLTEAEPNGYTNNWFYQFAAPLTYGVRVGAKF